MRSVSAATHLTRSTTTNPTTTTPEAPAAPAPGQRSERVGKYDEPLIALVSRLPGITVAHAAQELDVHPTALYPVIRRLETRDQVTKVGRGLQPGGMRHPSPRGSGEPQRLWCEAGHYWNRTPTRGRKPKHCPKHR